MKKRKRKEQRSKREPSERMVRILTQREEPQLTKPSTPFFPNQIHVSEQRKKQAKRPLYLMRSE